MNSNRLGKYTHIRSVCEWCAVDVNLVQKQVIGWDTSEIEGTIITTFGTNLGHQ